MKIFWILFFALLPPFSFATDLYQMGANAFEVQDYATAYRDFKKSALSGNADADNAIGLMFLNGYGVGKDPAQAAEWFRKGCAGGSALAEFQMGLCYDQGTGVRKDPSQAAYWYTKAAVAGVPEAQNNLGLLYEKGLGVAKDYSLAAYWYDKAAKQGDSMAQNNYAQLEGYMSQSSTYEQFVMYLWFILPALGILGIIAWRRKFWKPAASPAGAAKPEPQYPCPCCRHPVFMEKVAGDICPVCGWQVDGRASADEVVPGINDSLSLAQAQFNYLNHGRYNPERTDLKKADPPAEKT